MKQAENSLKCKAFLIKITKTASIFSFSGPFDVINSSTFPLKPERIAEPASKEVKKDRLLRFIASISVKIDQSGLF